MLSRVLAFDSQQQSCLKVPLILPAGASTLLGLEVAGVISEVGKGVTRFKKGDRVMALLDGGGYAEYAVAPEGFVMPLPKNLSFAEGAGIPEVPFWLLQHITSCLECKASCCSCAGHIPHLPQMSIRGILY